MEKNSSFLSLLFTLFNDLLNISIVVVIFAPMLMGSGAIFLEHASIEVKTTHLGFLLAAFPFAQFLTAPFFGSVSDSLGRKKTLLIALLGCCFFNVLSAISINMKSLTLLYISRFLAGALSGNAPLAQAAIADLSDKQSKAKNLSYVGVTSSLAWILGAPLGGILANDHLISWFNFSIPFWFSASLFSINFIWLAISFHETYKTHSEVLNFKIELLNIRKVFSIPKMKAPLSALFMYFVGWMMFIYFFPAIFVERFDFNQTEIGYIAGFTALCFWLGSKVTQKASASILPDKLVLIPFLSVGIFVFISSFLPIFWPYLIIFFFACGFSACVWISLMAVISNLAGEENQGKAFGVQQSLLSLASLLSPIIAGIIAPIDIKLPLVLAGTLLIVGFAIFTFFYRNKP